MCPSSTGLCAQGPVLGCRRAGEPAEAWGLAWSGSDAAHADFGASTEWGSPCRPAAETPDKTSDQSPQLTGLRLLLGTPAFPHRPVCLERGLVTSGKAFVSQGYLGHCRPNLGRFSRATHWSWE